MASTMNYGFLLLLSVMVALLVISIVNTSMAGLGTADELAEIGGATEVSVLLLLGLLVLRQTPQLAANLGGGIAIQTAGAFSSAVNQSRNLGKGSALPFKGGAGAYRLGGKARASYQKRFGSGIKNV